MIKKVLLGNLTSAFILFSLFIFSCDSRKLAQVVNTVENEEIISAVNTNPAILFPDDAGVLFTIEDLQAIGEKIATSQYPDPFNGWASTGGSKQTPRLVKMQVLYFFLCQKIRQPDDREKKEIEGWLLEHNENIKKVIANFSKGADEEYLYEYSSDYTISYFSGRFFWDYSYWLYYVYDEIYGNDDYLEEYVTNLMDYSTIDKCNPILYSNAAIIDILTHYINNNNNNDEDPAVLEGIKTNIEDALLKLTDNGQEQIESIDDERTPLMGKLQICDASARIIFSMNGIRTNIRNKILPDGGIELFTDYIDNYLNADERKLMADKVLILTNYSTVQYTSPVYLIRYIMKSGERDLKDFIAWGLAKWITENQKLDGSWDKRRGTMTNLKCIEMLLEIDSNYPLPVFLQDQIKIAVQRTLDWLENAKNSEGFWPVIAEVNIDKTKNVYELQSLLMIYDYTKIKEYANESVRALEYLTEKYFSKSINLALDSISNVFKDNASEEQIKQYRDFNITAEILGSVYERYSFILGHPQVSSILNYQFYIKQMLYGPETGIMHWVHLNGAYTVMRKEDKLLTCQSIIALSNLSEFLNEELKKRLFDSLEWLKKNQGSDYAFDETFAPERSSKISGGELSEDGGYKEYYARPSMQKKSGSERIIEGTINALYALRMGSQALEIMDFDNEIKNGISFVLTNSDFNIEKLDVFLLSKLYSLISAYEEYAENATDTAKYMKARIMNNDGYDFYFYVHDQKVIDAYGGPLLCALLEKH